jgi:hypothetical protein
MEHKLKPPRRSLSDFFDCGEVGHDVDFVIDGGAAVEVKDPPARVSGSVDGPLTSEVIGVDKKINESEETQEQDRREEVKRFPDMLA